MKRLIIYLFFSLGISVMLSGRSISPIDMGLNNAKNAEERYMVLYKTHKYALDNNLSVNYSGISHIDIAIPRNAPSIPLGKGCDFKGLNINVLNNSQTHTLFVMSTSLFPVHIPAQCCDEKDYKMINEFKRKSHLLVIQDQNPWGDKRQGYTYSPQRADIIYIEKGSGKNVPVSSYDNPNSNPKYFYCPADKKEKSIRNITINRDTKSSCLLFCFEIENQNNVYLGNITINTLENGLYGDQAIGIINCTNVVCERININGTYSRVDKYGYGIYMNNVWNSRFTNVSAKAQWGVFGTNNISDIYLECCDINRFDIHSYGRNVICSKCTFRDLYNQYSSVYGIIKYENCRFINSVPVVTEYSYNSYVAYDLIMDNCILEISREKNSIINIGSLHDSPNTRPELQNKSLPNVLLKNLTVIVPAGVEQLSLFQYYNPTEQIPEVSYISRINISGMEFIYNEMSPASPSFYIINSSVLTSNNLTIDINGMNILPNSLGLPKVKYYYPYSVIFNFNKSCSYKSHITISNSRLNYNTNANNVYDISYNNCYIGLVRYNSLTQGYRIYNDCYIYLNCVDDDMYYIDNNAVYLSCRFKLANSDFKVAFTGINNNIRFFNCVSDSFDIFPTHLDTDRILKDSFYTKNKFEFK